MKGQPHWARSDRHVLVHIPSFTEYVYKPNKSPKPKAVAGSMGFKVKKKGTHK
jgi:hypothetical protein